jgi:hypothetical protein
MNHSAGVDEPHSKRDANKNNGLPSIVKLRQRLPERPTRRKLRPDLRGRRLCRTAIANDLKDAWREKWHQRIDLAEERPRLALPLRNC